MNWNWKRNRSRAQQPDPENGTPHARGEKARAGDQPIEDDSDNNDKFWKLFLEEAVSEAQWKVSIRQAELDSLLVFAGLFAGVVSAFLVDLRSQLRPDPQLTALKDIASILRNDTAPPDPERASNVVIAAGALWYGSLVVTLIGALLGVLAKGWLGEILRETPNNPADRALERWRYDDAAKQWGMDNVAAGVPLLIQLGLAMFLTGLVVQSFGDNHAIGVEVLVYVIWGAFTYALFTVLPWFYPNCPYRTPLTYFLHLVSPDSDPTDEDTHNANTESKIKILMSRLNRSSNDDIFCSAASMLDVKLESHDSHKWYEGVVLQRKASEIAEALSVRLKGFAHRVQTIPEGPSLSILKDAASSGSTSGQALVGAIYSPIEQGIACLRILLKSIEASMSSEGDKSPWIKKDIDRQWRLSKAFPETWRLLSLSIHITRLVAKRVDYEKDDTAIDWENMISKTFSDQTLRSISGLSACRGLLHGEANLRRVCALGLAMFIETGVTGSTKSIFFDKEIAVEKGRVITERLWSELVKIWKDAVVQLLGRNILEWDVPENTLIDSDLLTKELYQNDIKSLVSTTMLEQLGSGNWATRKQAIRMLTKLSDQEEYQEVVKTSEAIPKIIKKLEDDDNDVRAATIEALSTFGKQDVFKEKLKAERALPKLIATLTDKDSDVQAAAVAAVLEFSEYDDVLYQDDINSSIPTIIKQLDNKDYDWNIRQTTVQILKKLSELDAFREAINIKETIPKVVATLEDDDSDVRAAAVEALEAFSVNELYQENIKLSIPTIIKQLDNESWEIRVQNIRILIKLSDLETFRKAINEGAIPKLVAKLEDDDSDVRAEAVKSLQAFRTEGVYQNNIKLSIPAITKQLDNDYWRVREQTVQILVQLFKLEAFRETLNIDGIIPKIFAKLADDDSDVRAAANAALQDFSTDESYYSDLKSLIPTIIKQLDDESWRIRQQAINMLKTFSKHDVFQETLKTNGVITKLISKLKDDDEDVRAAAVEAVLAFCTQSYFKEMVENSVSRLFEKVSDDNSGVRSAAFQAMSTLSTHEIYSDEIKSLVSISSVVSQLEDESWSTRQQAAQILAQLAINADFQEVMNTEKTVSKLATRLMSDTDEDVCAAIAEALSVFGAQETFQKALKSEKVIPKLTAKLSDSSSNVRSAAQSTMLALSTQVFYQNDIKSAIPTIMEQLEGTNWDIRQQNIQTLEKLSDISIFQETLKTDGLVAKLVAKLDDNDEDVRAAAAQALSALGTKDSFKEKIKADKALPKLVTKLADDHDTARDAVHNALVALGKQKDTKEFLQTVVTTLSTIDKPVRTEVYKLLTELKDSKDSDDFLNEIDMAVCELLMQMKDKDISFIRISIAILTEIGDEGLRGEDLKIPSATNRSTRDVVENIVRSKLIYGKNSPDRNDVVLTLSRLAKNELFLGCMRPAIPALIEAVSSNDRLGSASNFAVEAIVTLSTRDDFRTDLLPAVQKLIQKLSVWDDDEAYPLDFIKALPSLAEYKEFRSKLKHLVPILMEQLQKDVRNSTLDQDGDKNKVAFYQEACKLICKLCETNTVGRDLVSHLTLVLSAMHASLTGDLLNVVTSLIEYGKSELTMNDRIALASSLRIVPPVADVLEVQICKLTIAALLDEAHKSDLEPTEYSTFLGAVLGDGNDTVKLKLSTIVPPAPALAPVASINLPSQ